MPLLPVDPAHPPPSDRQTVFDALSFAQAPINVTRLAELLADRHTTRGTGFNTTSLRGLLGELLQAQQVGCNAQGQWWATPALSWPRFVALVQQPAECDRWWAAWRRLYRFDNTWHLEVFGDEANRDPAESAGFPRRDRRRNGARGVCRARSAGGLAGL